jgi:hypothetical protein
MPTEIPGCLLKGLRPLTAGQRSQDGGSAAGMQ